MLSSLNTTAWILFIFLTCTSLRCSESAKILGMFPVAGKSLNMLCNKLFVGLANAGHDVTLISTHENTLEIRNGSFRHILLTGFEEDYEKLLNDLNPWAIKEASNILASKNFLDLFSERWDKAFKIPEVQKFLKSNETFDVFITEDLWSDPFRIMGQIFDCPVVVFTSIGGNNPWLNADIGNPLPSSYVQHTYMVGAYSKGMRFFQRVQNFIFHLGDTLIRFYYMFPIYNKILQSNFDNPPDVSTFNTNVSLVLLGSHSSIRPPAPLLPNVVEIGGFHIDPPKKLPKDLQEFLDSATDGAIFFSMGTHVKSKDTPAATKKIFLDVFGKLKQKVLWKFEEDLPGKPDNVLIRKWLPQTDILAHPNIKLFITHGGYGSTLEAVYHGVPCIMIPVFFDQFNNAYQAVQHGFALKLSHNDNKFSESTLMETIEELLNNPKYRDNAKKKQHLFHDRPMKPLDTAIYWIEYIIRHKGADHLKVEGRNMPWYQLYSVDVIAFLSASVILILYLFYFVLKKTFSSKQNVLKHKLN